MEVVEKCYEYMANLERREQAIEESLIGIINIEATYRNWFRIYKMNITTKKIRIMGNMKLI
jgi:predicted transcriptional regulator with HTH domain